MEADDELESALLTQGAMGAPMGTPAPVSQASTGLRRVRSQDEEVGASRVVDEPPLSPDDVTLLASGARADRDKLAGTAPSGDGDEDDDVGKGGEVRRPTPTRHAARRNLSSRRSSRGRSRVMRMESPLLAEYDAQVESIRTPPGSGSGPMLTSAEEWTQ